MSRPSLHDDIAAALGPWADADPSRIEVAADSAGRRPAPAIRINFLGRAIDPADLPFVRSPVPWASDRAFFVDPHSRPGGHPMYGTGAYYIQDASSLLAVALLEPQPGELICDLCAAPGGKATAILEALGDTGFLLANEAIRSRLGPLRMNLARHGGWRYVLSALDPDRLADHTGPVFDAVLVDAPCTGQSMIVRGRQTVAALDARSVKLNARRQRRILRAAARLLRPGGRLVYSTCTYSWAENEEHIGELLSGVPHSWHPFSLPGLDPYLAGGPAPPACYRLWPDRHDCAGAFAARLRYEPPATSAAPPGSSRPRSRAIRPYAARDIPFDQWGFWRDAPVLIAGQRTCGALACQTPAWAASIGSAPEVAFKKGRTWFPAYALAMRRDAAFEPRRRQDLSRAEAAVYLSGRPGRAQADGWCVCTWRQLPLGWAKGTTDTLKNHLPPVAHLNIDPP
jgi:16S rRNA C967 or C1407 C5-methylase (RsmB/RsmF family)